MTAPQTGAHLNIRQAAFIGVAAMVGAGIFSLLGAAGEVAGAAVWLSFLIAGAIALLQGYSFAKFGARYPSAGGMLEYVRRGFGDGHVLGIVAWLLLFTNAIITAMVAVSFGSYAASAVNDSGTTATKLFAVLLLLVMTGLNIVGSKAVAPRPSSSSWSSASSPSSQSAPWPTSTPICWPSRATRLCRRLSPAWP